MVSWIVLMIEPGHYLDYRSMLYIFGHCIEIEAIRARIPNKQLKEKIENIVQKAKQIPL
jgi:hypothetical protein